MSTCDPLQFQFGLHQRQHHHQLEQFDGLWRWPQRAKGDSRSPWDLSGKGERQILSYCYVFFNKNAVACHNYSCLLATPFPTPISNSNFVFAVSLFFFGNITHTCRRTAHSLMQQCPSGMFI